jgi:phosphoglycerate dehydrogenase-like enzyme
VAAGQVRIDGRRGLVLAPDVPETRLIEAVPGATVLRFGPTGDLPDGALHADVLVPGKRPAGELPGLAAAMPGLRLVLLLSAGYDEWLGRTPEGVVVANARGAHSRACAEWVAGVLLADARDLPRYLDDQRGRVWKRVVSRGLDGARVLVVGAGDLGEATRRVLEPFGCAVTLVGRTARAGVRGAAELPELLGEADTVVLLVPLEASTRRMVDRTFLARMRDGAILVNASRGPVVATDDLTRELRAGRLRAALDVTDPEPLPAGHPLWDCPGLILTPHVAGVTDGFRTRSWSVAAEQLRSYLAGGDPTTLVIDNRRPR